MGNPRVGSIYLFILLLWPNGSLSERYWMMAVLIRRKVYVSVGGGKNHFLTPAYDYIHECIRDWHLGMDPEVGSSLEYEYSVTQSPPGDHIYGKYLGGRPGFASLAKKSNRNQKTFSWCQKAQVSVFFLQSFWGTMV